jgi:hypothetical protein
MSPRRNWYSPTPSLASDCGPPPGNKDGEGGAHSLAGEGLGESQSRRLEKSLALCLLCGLHYSQERKQKNILRKIHGPTLPSIYLPEFLRFCLLL